VLGALLELLEEVALLEELLATLDETLLAALLEETLDELLEMLLDALLLETLEALDETLLADELLWPEPLCPLEANARLELATTPFTVCLIQ
jgi:hypothetical protein